MNKKDIALTVGGVVATMILAWLLYRLQKRDSAAAAAAAQQQSSDAQANTDELYSLLSSQSPIYAGASTATPGIDTNAYLPTTGEPENDSAAGDSILTTLLGDLTTSLNGTNESSLIIPTLPLTNAELNNIPTSAAAALNGTIGNPTQNTTTDVTYVPPINTTVASGPRNNGLNGAPATTQLSAVN